MATTTRTQQVIIGGRTRTITVTERTGPDLQLIAGCKVLASASPARREQVLGGGFRFLCPADPTASITKFT